MRYLKALIYTILIIGITLFIAFLATIFITHFPRIFLGLIALVSAYILYVVILGAID